MSVLGTHNRVVNTDDWMKNGNLTSTFGGLPGTCREEVMGIVGAGELGSLPFPQNCHVRG